jgi:hypothetical protein
MKTILMVAILFALGLGSALAGGDQNHGDKGKGETHQAVGP